jgi:phosphopentomutase
MRFKRIILVVADSAGIGAMPDADRWGDAGSDTIGHTLAATGVLLPNLQRLGLGNIATLSGHPRRAEPAGIHGKAAIASQGKDTTVGHWEMAGILTEIPFPTYPHGFPEDVVAAIEERIGRRLLGNYPASGTEIIQHLGDEHVRTGRPILYTSADSVFQLAAHEGVIPLEELYTMCVAARELLQGPHRVARVIARPFVGGPGNYTRTGNRKDFAVPPPEPNLLSELARAGRTLVSVGKIASIFAWRHAGREIKTKNNAEGIRITHEAIASGRGDVVMTNLVDFDMLYGHRNDAAGYATALRELDDALPVWMAAMGAGDCLLITADHGCDPTTASTDHSREYVPVLGWAPDLQAGRDIGIRTSLADIGQTVADNFGFHLPSGQSFLGAFGAGDR